MTGLVGAYGRLIVGKRIFEGCKDLLACSLAITVVTDVVVNEILAIDGS